MTSVDPSVVLIFGALLAAAAGIGLPEEMSVSTWINANTVGTLASVPSSFDLGRRVPLGDP